MSANPYMPLYVADYLADTAHLSTLESGAYMLLLMHYWRRGKPLDNSNGRLANVARMSNEEWAAAESTLAEFFQIEGDMWTHKRVEVELARAKEKSRKASEAGKTSAQRRSNGRSTDVQPGANLSESESDLRVKQLPLEQDAAREASEEQVVRIDHGFGRKKFLKGSVSDDLKGRAEGLGLDVDALARKAETEATTNVDGYFQTLCRNQIREQLPGINDKLLGRALSSDAKARATVMQLMIQAMEHADAH